MRVFILVFLLACLSLTTFAEEPTIPDAVPLIEVEGDVLNILLIGSATHHPTNAGLTDTLLLVSVNTTTNHVSVISLPRDLYVYIPDYGMGKLNQAYAIGMNGENDVDRLKATVEYNLGIPIHHYARVNFTGFKALVDAIGGIRITVDCAIQDWRLRSPELDPQNEDNWYMYTLWTGVRYLDGDLTLWYVRSRRNAFETDRGRRQQDVLRAIWRKLRTDGLLDDIPTLWNIFQEYVDTDLTLNDAMHLLPTAMNTELADVRFGVMRDQVEIFHDYEPENGRFIFRIDNDAMRDFLTNALQTDTSRRIAQAAPHVAIVNVTGVNGMDQVAADRLERSGFTTTILDEYTQPRQWNYIIDYTGMSKGNPIGIVQSIFRIDPIAVDTEPQSNRQYDYKLYLGERYTFNACTHPVIQPEWVDEDGDGRGDTGEN